MLAVIAAELRSSSTAKKTPSSSDPYQKRLLPEFPVPMLFAAALMGYFGTGKAAQETGRVR